MTTPLVIDAVEHAIWTRQRDGFTDLTGVIHHNDRLNSPNTPRSRSPNGSSIPALTRRSGRRAQATTVALAETVNGLCNTELIKPQGPWRTLDQVEIATLEWVDWFNNRRIHEHCGDMAPVELEALYHQRNKTRQPAELSN